MDTFLGIAMIYSTIHFFIIQQKAYENRTQWEKIVTWMAMISIALLFIGTVNN